MEARATESEGAAGDEDEEALSLSLIHILPDFSSIKIFPVSQDAAAKEYEAVVTAWNQAVAKAK